MQVNISNRTLKFKTAFLTSFLHLQANKEKNAESVEENDVNSYTTCSTSFETSETDNPLISANEETDNSLRNIRK